MRAVPVWHSNAMTSITALLAGALDVPEDFEGLDFLIQNASFVDAPADHRLFATGDEAPNFILVAEGTARVQISTISGREVVLFRLKEGQSCALTTSCLITNSPYYAEGLSDTPLKLVSIPAAKFKQAINQYPRLAISLIDNYAARVGQLTGVIDRLISRNLSDELEQFLHSNADQDGCVLYSHQKIADELGSSREVISRKLKVMEREGLIKLARGQIRLLNIS